MSGRQRGRRGNPSRGKGKATQRGRGRGRGIPSVTGNTNNISSTPSNTTDNATRKGAFQKRGKAAIRAKAVPSAGFEQKNKTSKMCIWLSRYGDCRNKETCPFSHEIKSTNSKPEEENGKMTESQPLRKSFSLTVTDSQSLLSQTESPQCSVLPLKRLVSQKLDKSKVNLESDVQAEVKETNEHDEDQESNKSEQEDQNDADEQEEDIELEEQEEIEEGENEEDQNENEEDQNENEEGQIEDEEGQIENEEDQIEDEEDQNENENKDERDENQDDAVEQMEASGTESKEFQYENVVSSDSPQSQKVYSETISNENAAYSSLGETKETLVCANEKESVSFPDSNCTKGSPSSAEIQTDTSESHKGISHTESKRADQNEENASCNSAETEKLEQTDIIASKPRVWGATFGIVAKPQKNNLSTSPFNPWYLSGGIPNFSKTCTLPRYNRPSYSVPSLSHFHRQGPVPLPFPSLQPQNPIKKEEIEKKAEDSIAALEERAAKFAWEIWCGPWTKERETLVEKEYNELLICQKDSQDKDDSPQDNDNSPQDKDQKDSPQDKDNKNLNEIPLIQFEGTASVEQFSDGSCRGKRSHVEEPMNAELLQVLDSEKEANAAFEDRLVELLSNVNDIPVSKKRRLTY